MKNYVGMGLTLVTVLALLHQVGCGDGIGVEPQLSSSGHGEGGDLGFVATGGQGVGDQCAGESHQGQQVPVDLLFLVDTSWSMSDDVGGASLWELVRGALTSFVESPDADGIRAAMQYFPQPNDQPCAPCTPTCALCFDTGAEQCCASPSGELCVGNNGHPCEQGGRCFYGVCLTAGNLSTCDVDDYAALDVPFSTLPQDALTLVSSLAAQSPSGGTPLAPAVQGALATATDWAKAHPDHAVALVVAADGEPTECQPEGIDDIDAMIQQAANATPPVRTYAIGFGNLPALHTLAAAGGTDEAFLVAANSNADEQFLAALDAIRGSVTCEFAIPQPDEGDLDYKKVNVTLTPADGSPITIPYVADASQCNAFGGWYYDSVTNPEAIVLCEASCAAFGAAGNASIDIVLGCTTIIK